MNSLPEVRQTMQKRSSYHLAQINVARLLAPLDAPSTAEFRDNLDRINVIAEASPGFIWRLQSDDSKVFEMPDSIDPLLIINQSVWSGVEELKQFAYHTEHVDFYRKRKNWFERPQQAHMALWWIPVGHQPDALEGLSRLRLLRKKGESKLAFSFRKMFEPPLAQSIHPDFRTS